MPVTERYDERELEDLQKRKQKAIKRRERRDLRRRDLRRRKKDAIHFDRPVEDELKDVSLESDQSDNEGPCEVEEQTTWPAAGLQSPRFQTADKGFMALAFFLDASSRRHLPPSRTQEGVFPTEIYRAILLNIEDVETHRACMQVSSNFWDICQDDILMMNKTRLRANEASKTYKPGTPELPALRMENMSTGLSPDVTLKSSGMWLSDFGRLWAPRETWQFVVGSDHNRRSLVSGLTVTFDRVDWYRLVTHFQILDDINISCGRITGELAAYGLMETMLKRIYW